MTPDAAPLPGPTARLRPHLAMAAFALTVLASKFLLIAGLGSMTPYKDQWGSEGYAFFAPLFSGTLPWYGIFAPHEEHRIVMTRLLDLGLLLLNGGIWNSLPEMVAGALLHVAALVILVTRLIQGLDARQQRHVLLFSTLLFCLPFNCGNTLWGFQSQVYFLLFFSFLSLWLFSRSQPLAAGWWAALALAVCACLSFASGVAVLAAALGLLLARWRQPDRGARAFVAALLLLVLTVAGVAATPQVPPDPHAPPGAPAGFFFALLETLSWPLPPPLGLLVYYPLLRFMLRLATRPGPASPVDRFILALGLWELAQLILFSYGRTDAPLATRYTDIFSVGTLLNFACLVRAAPSHPGRRQRILAWLWLVTVLLALPIQAAVRVWHYAGTAIPYTQATEQHVRVYLASGNPASLQLREFPGLVMKPSAAEMRLVLDVPAIRDMLPPSLVPAHAVREAAWVAALPAALQPLALALLTLALLAVLKGRPGPQQLPPADKHGQHC